MAGCNDPDAITSNNLTREVLEAGDRYGAGFLEGEDSCESDDDFTLDFDDRGMGGNGSDGTDWGEADDVLKCGIEGVDTGQWFVFVRERDVVIPELDITNFEGPVTDIPDDRIEGWCQCHTSRYAESNIDLRDIRGVWNGDFTMLGCRPAGGPRWSVLAMAETAQVFRNTGEDNNRTNNSNGSGWYYSINQSMGFAPLGIPIRRASCDTDNTQAERKLCWHTENQRLMAGWRCGEARGLNGGLDWERAIWTRGGQHNQRTAASMMRIRTVKMRITPAKTVAACLRHRIVLLTETVRKTLHVNWGAASRSCRL